jgi:hypothetical protein
MQHLWKHRFDRFECQDTYNPYVKDYSLKRHTVWTEIVAYVGYMVLGSASRHTQKSLGGNSLV